MVKSINVTEEEIFNYVFFKSLLKEEQVKAIESGNPFSKGIEFYIYLKKIFSEEIPYE